MGSPPFAVSVLEALLQSPRHTVAAVVTRPDKPRGRGRKVEETPLVALARARGIPVLQPERARTPEFVAELRSLAPDVAVVASFGEILTQDVLDVPRHGCLNVHASLLPRHRGASPIQAALLAGDRETGVSIQRMVLALDEGDVLVEERTPIGAHETSGELFDRLAVMGGALTVRALDAIDSGTARYTPQDPARATYARKIKKEHGLVDWTRDCDEIDRLVRAFTPWPGARTLAPNGTEIALLDVRPLPANSATSSPESGTAPSSTSGDHGGSSPTPAARVKPGTITAVRPGLVVQCGSGALEVRALKPAGKGRMDARAWLNGAHVDVGAVLGGA